MKIFFYGLFMDERLLAGKGIKPSAVGLGFVDGYGLRIGARATLVPQPDSRAYGAVMEIAPSEAAGLYAEQSVADYLPESVMVTLTDGTQVEATCYNLPIEMVAGTNNEYAQSLLAIASRLGFPDFYLEQIRQACI